MKQFKKKIYFHREKEDNQDIISKAKKLDMNNTDELRYLGYEVEMNVQITEKGTKILKLEGVDISDKDIWI